MSLHRLFLSVIVMLAVATSAHADVYKYYDSNGNLVLSDSPPKDRDKASKAEKIETRPVMTIPAFKGGKSALSANEKPAVKQPREYVIVIQSPNPEIGYQRNSQEPIPVAVSVSPALVGGHRLEFLLDGKISPGLASLQPAELDRGSHQLLLRVVDGANKVLASSSVTFQVQQHSTLGPLAPKSKPKP